MVFCVFWLGLFELGVFLCKCLKGLRPEEAWVATSHAAANEDKGGMFLPEGDESRQLSVQAWLILCGYEGAGSGEWSVCRRIVLAVLGRSKLFWKYLEQVNGFVNQLN